jgi:diketogulonate reductase-like aldo/keto reductase
MALEPWITTAAGIKMPRLIYGTAWKKERTADLVEKAFKLGFRGVDTACQVRDDARAPCIGIIISLNRHPC